MKKTKSFKKLLWLAVIPLLAGCASSNQNIQPQGSISQNDNSTQILARVGEGDKDICLSEFQQRLSSAPVQGANFEDQKEKTLDRMVLIRLLSLDAKAEGIDREKRIENLIQREIDKILAREYNKRKIRAMAKASEEDIKAYYNSNKSEFFTPAMVRAQYIRVGVKENAPAQTWANAEKKANALKNQITPDADFASLVWEHSEDKGARPRWYKKPVLAEDYLPDWFPESAFSMEKGEISNPVRGEKGYYIIKIESKRPEHVISLAQAGPRIKRKLEKSRYEQLLAETLTLLKEKYSVAVDKKLLESVEFDPSMISKGCGCKSCGK